MTDPARFLEHFRVIQEVSRRAQAQSSHEFSSSKVTATLSFDEIDIERLLDFSSGGHLVELTIRSGDDFSAVFVADSAQVFAAPTTSGSVETVTSDRDLSTKGLEACEPDVLASSIEGAEVSVSLTLRPSSGIPFVWSEDYFRSAPAIWNQLLLALAGCHRLLVLGAADGYVETRSLLIHGPDYDPLPPPDDRTRTLLKDSVATASHYAPIREAGMPAVAAALRRLASAALWMRVARTSTVSGSAGEIDVIVNYDADTSHQVRIGWSDLPEDATEVDAGVRLADWLVHDDGGVRLEAARRAAATSIRAPADLSDAATATLRQARFLDEQSRHSAVAAVVEARRTAWNSAHEAAHAAAGEARASARTSADRSVAAVIASLAVVITHQTSVVSLAVSYVVLGAVAVGLVATWMQAERFEFPSTQSALSAALAELRTTGRHVLLREDIDEIENGPVVTNASDAIGKAQTTSRAALIMAAAAIAGGFLAVNVTSPGDAATPPVTSVPATQP